MDSRHFPALADIRLPVKVRMAFHARWVHVGVDAVDQVQLKV